MADANAPLLTLTGISKTFHMGEVQVPVLHEIDLEVPADEIMVIVGPSGSGKTTLLNLVGGIDTPSSGQVLFEDKDLAKVSEAERTAYRRSCVGFVFQFYNLVPTLTALENVLVATEISTEPLDAAEALKMVGLEHRVDHFPAQMSGGEQQRVAIARALAKNPRLLLCDEPTGALDLDTGKQVLQLLGRLNEQLGKAIVIITHNSAIAGLAHRIVRIGSGRITESIANDQRQSVEEMSW